MTTENKIHPAANLFPMMGDKEYRELVADIKANGLRQSVMMVGETRETALIIDGRNRAKALAELGLDLNDHADVMAPDDIPDPVEFVLSLNLHRRHLTESQRAMVASSVAGLRDGVNKGSSIELPAKSQSEAAAQLNVGVASVKRARKVQEQAVPAIVAAVERGDITVSAAADVASLPLAEQQQLIEAGPKAVKAAAATARKAKVKAKPKTTAKEVAATKQAQRKGPDTPKPFAELREMFDTMEKPDEQAVTRFVVWAMTLSDLKQVMSGCSLWLDWSQNDSGVKR